MFGLISKALGSSCHEAQAMAFREMVEMSGANPRKVHDLCVGEDFLAHFNRDHVLCARRLGVIYIVKNSDTGRGRPMNRSQESSLRLIQELSSCAKEPRLECAS